MGKENYEELTALKCFLGYDCYNKLEEMNFKKGQEIYLSGIYIVAEGELEYFYLGKNGEYIKTIDCSPNGFFMIGAGKYFNIEQLHPFYRIKSKVVLKKLPPEIVDILMKNSDFSNWFIKFIFKYLGKILQDLFIRSTAPGEEVIKYLLKKECSEKNTITIDNIFEFVDKHNLNRSSFYKSLKNLEETGSIKRSGKKIKLLK